MKDLQEYLMEAMRVDEREEVISLINNLKEKDIADVTIEDGNGGKDSKYMIRYKRGLVYWIDFINKYEYLWGYEAPDGTSISTNTTSEVGRTDWELELDPSRSISFKLNNIKKHMGQFKSEHTRAQNAYKRTNKNSDYEKAWRAEDKIRSCQNRIAKYEQISKFA